MLLCQNIYPWFTRSCQQIKSSPRPKQSGATAQVKSAANTFHPGGDATTVAKGAQHSHEHHRGEHLSAEHHVSAH